MVSEASDTIIRGLIEHQKIEILDFSNNFLDDKTGYMMSRLINRQSERRDETVWKFGLRNERPSGADFKKGLAAINLSDNFLSENSAESFAAALQTDTYLRSLCLSRNQFFLEGCKKLVRAMRRNCTLLNLDIRENYGYNENIHKRILVKISRNVKMQFKNFNEFGIGCSKDNEYLKGFVDFGFFNVEIPQEVLDRFQYMLQENEEQRQQQMRFGNAYDMSDSEFNRINNNSNNNYLNVQQQYSNNPFASFGNPNYVSGGVGNHNNNNNDKERVLVDNDYSAENAEDYSENNKDNFHQHNSKANKLGINNKYDDHNNEDESDNSNEHAKNNNNNAKNNKNKNNINRERKPSNVKHSESNVSTTKNNQEAANQNKNFNPIIKNKPKTNSNKKGSVGAKENKQPTNNINNLKLSENNAKNKQNSSDNSNPNNNSKKKSAAANLKPKANLEEKRFEYKIEKTQKNENKSKSEDIQFELEADNEYDKIINEENENDEDFIFRNYSDGEIFLKNEITNEINYSLPQINQTNIDTYFAKDNNNKNVIEFNYNKNANKFFEKNKFCRCSRDFKKVYVDINRKNKLLFLETLKLRKQLLTVRAINLSMNQQRLNNNNCKLNIFLF